MLSSFVLGEWATTNESQFTDHLSKSAMNLVHFASANARFSLSNLFPNDRKVVRKIDAATMALSVLKSCYPNHF